MPNLSERRWIVIFFLHFCLKGLLDFCSTGPTCRSMCAKHFFFLSEQTKSQLRISENTQPTIFKSDIDPLGSWTHCGATGLQLWLFLQVSHKCWVLEKGQSTDYPLLLPQGCKDFWAITAVTSGIIWHLQNEIQSINSHFKQGTSYESNYNHLFHHTINQLSLKIWNKGAVIGK